MDSPEKEARAIDFDKLETKPPDLMADDRILLAWHRSHMANERTFLSWSRTSLGLLGFGFVMERFDIFIRHLMRLEGIKVHRGPSDPIVVLSFMAFILAGSLILASGLRFLAIRRHINRGEAVFSILPEFLVGLSVVVIIVMAVILSLPSLWEMTEFVAK